MGTVHAGKQDPASYRAMLGLAAAVNEHALASGLQPGLLELVRIRVSQLNGCAYCLRLHTRDALRHGEMPDRLAVLPAWRETSLFAPTETAALRLAEAITTVATTHDAGEATERAVDDGLTAAQAAGVVWVATVMNAFNRIATASGYPVET